MLVFELRECLLGAKRTLERYASFGERIDLKVLTKAECAFGLSELTALGIEQRLFRRRRTDAGKSLTFLLTTSDKFELGAQRPVCPSGGERCVSQLGRGGGDRGALGIGAFALWVNLWSRDRIAADDPAQRLKCGAVPRRSPQC